MGAGGVSGGGSGNRQGQQQEWCSRRQLPELMTFMLLQWLPHVTHTLIVPPSRADLPPFRANLSQSGERPTTLPLVVVGVVWDDVAMKCAAKVWGLSCGPIGFRVEWDAVHHPHCTSQPVMADVRDRALLKLGTPSVRVRQAFGVYSLYAETT